MPELNIEEISQKIDELTSLATKLAVSIEQMSIQISQVDAQLATLIDAVDDELEEPLITLDGEYAGMDRDLTQEL